MSICAYPFLATLPPPDTLAQKAAAANVRWPNGHQIRVVFLTPADAIGTRVRQALYAAAGTWSGFANITWAFHAEPIADPDVTVNMSPALAPYGSYSSYLGVECRSAAAAGQPSMHLVFDPDSPDNTDAELNRVCLHELGHALGLIHEHERPDRPLVWNQPAVLAYYRHLTDWSWADIKQQVIDPYEAPIIIETAFDPQSIMMYPFPAGLATYENGTPFVTGWNQTLSNRDKAIAGAMYPFPSVPTGAP